jgi:hypothetical protein
MSLLKSVKLNTLLKIILAIVIIELFSLLSFKIVWLSGIFFVLILIGTISFTLYKLEYGLWICLTELIIGSYGYLFYLQFPNFKMPIRLAIFLTVFFIWLVKYCRPQKLLNFFKKDHLVQNLLVFIIFLTWGIINGLINKHGFNNVFFDVNGYLYLGLIFVFIEVFKNKSHSKTLINILTAALTYVTLKIFFTLYLFSHSIPYLPDLFYHWIRDTRVGEITYAGANFFRIFFQSQIWTLAAIFILWSLLLFKQNIDKKSGRWLLLLILDCQTSILISFSRSFWLGGFIAMGLLFMYLLITQFKNWQNLLKKIGLLLGTGLLSIILMIAIANFPIPKPQAYFTADMLWGRLALFGEAGASSRWNQLPVLIEKIKASPLIGSGFGTTITFKTEDPRIKNEANPEGWYTTYTFEWGYLDTITEMGVLGLIVYLSFIGQIFYLSLISQADKWLKLGLLLGLAAIAITNISSPYLNHPLGIGYLLLCLGVLAGYKIDKKTKTAYT